MYVQMAFLLDRVKELVPKNPEWKNKQPFKAVLERDLKSLAAQGEKGAAQLVAATHTGMPSEEFNRRRKFLEALGEFGRGSLRHKNEVGVVQEPIEIRVRGHIRELIGVSAQVEDLWHGQPREGIAPDRHRALATLFHKHDLPVVEAQTDTSPSSLK